MKKEFHTVRGYQILEQDNKHLTSAMEDYLEMIYRSSMEEGYIRIGKLAELLNVSAPSASKMVQKLSEIGLLKFEKYGIIMLSETGRDVGEYLLERHVVLEKFIKLLGCEDNLLQQTELIEHTVNQELLKNIKIFSGFLQENNEIRQQYETYRGNYIRNKKYS